jgi:RNA-binding protein YlmH
MHVSAILFSAVLTTTLSFTLAFTVSLPTRQVVPAGILNRRYDVLLHYFSVDDIESKAQTAAEAWDTHVTSFLSTKEADMVEERLQNRADVACFRIGGRGAESSRARFVFTNPELGLDYAAAEAEYCAVVCVKNAKTSSDPWPNILARIGVDLDDVGDIVVVEGLGCYMAVSPAVSKKCVRLLAKEVMGAGVLVNMMEPGTPIPKDGELQDMEVQRLDKRQQKRK